MSAIVVHPAIRTQCDPRAIADLAFACLMSELATFPKPGLVSLVDAGSHSDMNAATFRASARAIHPYLRDMAQAGAEGCGMTRLRMLGLEAEAAMLAATGGVNTHRGAIFGLGLLCAAAGHRAGSRDSEALERIPIDWIQTRSSRGGEAESGTQESRSGLLGPGFSLRQPRDDKDVHTGSTNQGYALGAIVARLWGPSILRAPLPIDSHGVTALRRYGAGGARREAASGFPTLYRIGMPALRRGMRRAPGDAEAARVEACFALIAALEDTNILHRAGPEGLRFARRAAETFLAEGGVGGHGWRMRARAVHEAFVGRHLSPGGSADLLAMTLMVHALDGPAQRA